MQQTLKRRYFEYKNIGGIWDTCKRHIRGSGWGGGGLVFTIH